jgi:outer membrane protein OmpA-like peptidoglycan-associated protein
MLVHTLNTNPKMIIEVAGHADFIGNEAYNYHLSLERAKNVLQYLVEKGIDKSRLRPRGFGENIPAPGTDDSDEGRAKNRRTEFTIIAR